MSSENGSDVDSGLVGTAQEKLPGQMSGATSQAPAPEQTAQAGAQSGEGRRTQLKIVRENIQSLSKDVGSFRKSHEVSIKSLEKQLASLRKEMASRARASDTGGLGKSYEASAKKMDKQVATLRNDLSALKSSIAKDAAKSRAKQEAMLAKILTKVSKSSKPAKQTKQAKRAKR